MGSKGCGGDSNEGLLTTIDKESCSKMKILSDAVVEESESFLNLLRACSPDSSDKSPGKWPVPDPRPPPKADDPEKKSSVSLQEMKDQYQIRASAPKEVLMDVQMMAAGKKAKSKQQYKCRQKALQEKIKDRKDHVNKLKVAAWGNMVLEKSQKSQSNLTTTIADARSSKPDASALPDPETVHASAETKSNSPRDTCLKVKKTHLLKETDYYAGIPYDKTLQKHIPQDDKDRSILMLISLKQELQKKLDYWDEWGKEKVMEATKRLSQDQVELKKLRQEKVDEEKRDKEKQKTEDSFNKRVLEMETALSKANSQIDETEAYFRKLKEENVVLKSDLEVSILRSTQSHKYLEEAIEREQEAMRKCQTVDTKKGLYLDQLANAKNEVAELENQIRKVKERQNQFKVLRRQEEREKVKAIAKLESLRAKREEDEAFAVAEANSIRDMAEINIKKTKEGINNLENKISKLKLKEERSKIVALKSGYGSSSNSITTDDFFTFRSLQPLKTTESLPLLLPNKFGSGRARECVMCMTKEISVLFLPCAHQVLCLECNILHENQGMNDCPSCRTSIVKRIPVKYRQI